ncbi:MAG: ABC transporter ATP-binding protein [Duncaniella sp.]|nr:ABC transporter ATP-binding protein [Duncaniella sp.]
MIDLDHLTYTYPHSENKALDCATGSIAPGIHLLMGENGAGKTTLLKVAAGLLRPTSGECRLDGASTLSLSPDIRRKIFFIPDRIDLPTATVNEYAILTAGLYDRFDAGMLSSNLQEFGLTGDEPLQNLSLGMLHKTLIAYGLSLRPDLLLLDEPANGLDISSRKTMRAMMARCIDEHQTAIISTHTPSDLHALYDGVIMLTAGKIKLCHPTWHIASRLGFIASTVPPADALFTEADSGRFLSVVPAGQGAGEGDVDFGVLYAAMQSSVSDSILQIINSSSNDY